MDHPEFEVFTGFRIDKVSDSGALEQQSLYLAFVGKTPSSSVTVNVLRGASLLGSARESINAKGNFSVLVTEVSSISKSDSLQIIITPPTPPDGIPLPSRTYYVQLSGEAIPHPENVDHPEEDDIVGVIKVAVSGETQRAR